MRAAARHGRSSVPLSGRHRILQWPEPVRYGKRIERRHHTQGMIDRSWRVAVAQICLAGMRIQRSRCRAPPTRSAVTLGICCASEPPNEIADLAARGLAPLDVNGAEKAEPAQQVVRVRTNS